MKLLYFLPYVDGGMADYAIHQLPALAEAGFEVTLLCPARREGPWWAVKETERPYKLLPKLRGVRKHSGPAWIRKPRLAADIVMDGWTLAIEANRGRFSRVLFGTFVEYLAPLWTPPLRRLASRCNTVFGAVVHDPVRDHIVGPPWWHRWSIACMYATLREAFVHAPVQLDTVRQIEHLHTTVIPQGLYAFPAPLHSRDDARKRLQLPTDAKVILAFGHIRDGKNLDLVLRAMAALPQFYLVIAGREQSSGQKPAEFYRALAQELGVDNRCRWLNRFIPSEEVGDLFLAADLLALTYSADFHSASAVLNASATYQLPCIASGGDGNLRQAVRDYCLGIWIETDSSEAIADGLRQWLAGGLPTARWDDYSAENSWKRNAQIIADRFKATQSSI